MDPNHTGNQVIKGRRSGSPPGIFRGAAKTYFRYNLITGTIVPFTVFGIIAAIPFFFSSIVVRIYFATKQNEILYYL